MAYGIELLDVNGKTIFNSNNPTELVVWKAAASGGVHLAIPDYCYGWDTTVSGSTTTATNTAGIPATVAGATENLTYWSSVYDIAFPWNPLADYTGAVLSLNTGNVYFEHVQSEILPKIYGVVGSDYSNAYVVWRMSKDVSGIRGTAASRSITLNTTHEVFPSIYARPRNPSVTPVIFGMRDTKPSTPNASSRYNRGITILDRNGAGSNTFDIVVAIPAKDWGGVLSSRTSKYKSGSTSYGLEAYTPNTQYHHSASTVGQFLTYSTLSRPTKFSASATLYARGSDWRTARNITPFPRLTSSTAPYDRYCRMNPTRHHKGEVIIQGQANPYTRMFTYQYDWRSNYDIRLRWDSILPGVNNFADFSTSYTSQQLYGIVDFGAGL